MKNNIVFSFLLSFSVLLSACAGQDADPSARLKKGIVIDGVNVSSLTVREAEDTLNRVHDRLLSGTFVTLRLNGVATAYPLSALGITYDTASAVRSALKQPFYRRGGYYSSERSVDADTLDALVRGYIESNEALPVDAAVTHDPTSPTPVSVTAEQNGIDILDAKLTDAVRLAADNAENCVIDVPYVELPASISAASILESYALVSQYTTSFASSPYNAENRVYNIRKAADAINGVTLLPGEEFDCNRILGDRAEETGWREATAIRNGRYETEYGGGVCQVSSTLFNAVMMADLTITERHPHSWPMGYVEIGRDATISTGGKNFRFVNSTDAPISVYMVVDPDNRTVTASIYGKPLPDGTYIEITSEKTGTIESAGTVTMLDETLPSQTTALIREPRNGQTAVTYKEYRAKDGTLLDRVIAYEDTYHAIDGLTYVSTDIFYP